MAPGNCKIIEILIEIFNVDQNVQTRYFYLRGPPGALWVWSPPRTPPGLGPKTEFLCLMAWEECKTLKQVNCFGQCSGDVRRCRRWVMFGHKVELKCLHNKRRHFLLLCSASPKIAITEKSLRFRNCRNIARKSQEKSQRFIGARNKNRNVSAFSNRSVFGGVLIYSDHIKGTHM